LILGKALSAVKPWQKFKEKLVNTLQFMIKLGKSNHFSNYYFKKQPQGCQLALNKNGTKLNESIVSLIP
jgi:hypothetical protein